MGFLKANIDLDLLCVIVISDVSFHMQCIIWEILLYNISETFNFHQTYVSINVINNNNNIIFLQGSSVSYNKAAIKRSPVLNKIVFALFAKNKN